MRSRSLLLGSLVAAAVVHFAHRNLPFALLPSLRDDLGLGYTARAALGTAFFLAFGLSAIPLGWLADRVGHGRLLLAGTLLWTLGTGACALAPGPVGLVALRALTGLGQATFHPTATSLLAAAYPEGQRARVLGLLNVGMLLGVVAGLGAGGTVGEALGWRGAFLAYAAPGLVLLPVLALALRGGWSRAGGEAARGPSLAALREALGRPSLLLTCLSGVFIAFCVGGVGVFLVNYVEERFGLGQGRASLIGGGVGLASALLGTLGGAVVADRLHARRPGGRPLVIGWACLLAVPFGCMGLAAERLWSFALLFGLFGVLMSAYAGPIVATVQGSSPAALRATTVAVYLTVCRLLGDGPSPAVAGAVADRAGDLGAGLLVLVLALAPAALFAFLAARALEREAGPRLARDGRHVERIEAERPREGAR